MSFHSKLHNMVLTKPVSRNTFKVDPQSSSTGKAGSIISFTLPSNSLIDLDSLALWMDAKVVNTNGARAARLPNKISSLIERCDISISGQTINSFSGYNTLSHIKDCTLPTAAFKGKSVLNHESIPTSANNFDGAALTLDETYALNPSFCLRNFFGFLGESSVRILDTSLIGVLTVKFTLADNAVCIVANSNALNAVTANDASVYQIDNAYMSIDCISFVDSSDYDALVQAQLADGGYIEIAYKNYVSTNGTTATTRFSVSSGSIDVIYAAPRPAAYATQGLPITVASQAIEVNGGAAPEQMIKTVSKYFQFNKCGVTSWLYRVNGVQFPAFQAPLLQAYANLLKLTDKGEALVQSYNQYTNTHCILPIKMNVGNTISERTGFDSRGSQCNMELVLNGLTGADVFVLVEYTSILKIGAGKMVCVDV